jgi:hypothetical protein
MKTIIALAIVVCIACFIAFPILALLGVNSPLPFSDWGRNLTTRLNSVNLAGVTGVDLSLIGGLGGATGAAAGLGWLYKQVKKANTTLTSSLSSLKIDTANQVTASKTAAQTAEEKAAALQQTYTAKQEELSKVATDAKTQYANMQTNYSKIESEKNTLKMNYDDAKAQLDKARAQLEVLTPKVK